MTDDYFSIDRAAADGTPVTRIRLSGEFDLSARDELREVLLEAVDGGGAEQIEVDLAGVRFMDSEGVSALLDGWTAADAAGVGFLLQRPTPLVHRIFEVIGMTHLFDFSER